MEALEGAEQLLGVRHVEARPVVAHEVDRAALARLGADLDAGVRLLARELPGVAEQVGEDHAQQAAVASCHDPAPHGDLHRPARLGGLQLLDHLERDGAEVDLGFFERRAREPRQREQVVDQLPHTLRGVANAVQVVAAAVVEAVAGVLQQRLAEAVDGAQGRA